MRGADRRQSTLAHQGRGPYNLIMPLDLTTISGEGIREFCRRNGLRRLAIFGSALRDDFGPKSDIDVLVEFEPGQRVGLRFFAMQDELSRMLGRKVDLNTPGFISRYFRDQVMAEARNLYVAA